MSLNSQISPPNAHRTAHTRLSNVQLRHKIGDKPGVPLVSSASGVNVTKGLRKAKTIEKTTSCAAGNDRNTTEIAEKIGRTDM